VTARQLYEQHLSSGYAPIFKAAMTGSYDERAQYIHEARVAVRTDKDRESEAKLEKMQGELDGSFVKGACHDWKAAADVWEGNRQSGEENVALSRSTDDLERQLAELQGRPYRASGKTPAELKTGIRATAGLPPN
jgi:hypothetical protein